MVLRVKPTPTRFQTNSLYTHHNTPLHPISSVCHPLGFVAVGGKLSWESRSSFKINLVGAEHE